GGGGRVDDVGDLLVADALGVGDGAHGGAGEDGRDGAALVEHDAHEPGEELGAARPADDAPAGPDGGVLRAASAGPQTDEPAQAPEVDEQDDGVGLAADGGQEVRVDDVVVRADEPADDDAEEQGADDLAGDEHEDERHERRQQGGEAVVLGAFG